MLSPVWLLSIPWTVACQVPLSMEFSRQEYWSGLLCPPPGDLPNPGIEPGSPALQVDSLPAELLKFSCFYIGNTFWGVNILLPYYLHFNNIVINKDQVENSHLALRKVNHNLNGITGYRRKWLGFFIKSLPTKVCSYPLVSNSPVRYHASMYSTLFYKVINETLNVLSIPLHCGNIK